MNSVKKQVEETEAADNMEDKQEETDDLSFLLDQMTSDDPVAANIKDISDIIEGKKVDSQPISDDWKETKIQLTYGMITLMLWTLNLLWKVLIQTFKRRRFVFCCR